MHTASGPAHCLNCSPAKLAALAGVSVIGAYLLASESMFAAAVPQLCGLAKALRAEAGDDRLLLHIDASKGKVRSMFCALPVLQPIDPLIICHTADPVQHRAASKNTPGVAVQMSLREYAAGGASSAAGLKPVELRLTAVLPAFQTLRCSVDVDMTAPVAKASTSMFLCMRRVQADVMRSAAILHFFC